MHSCLFVVYSVSLAGGMDLYVRQFGLKNHDDFYTNETLIAAFENYTTQVVSRYVNSPAIFAWYDSNLMT